MKKLWFFIIILSFPVLCLARDFGTMPTRKASNIKTDTSLFSGILGPSDTTVQKALQTLEAIDTSSEIADILDDETGTGALVFASSPSLLGQITITNTNIPSGEYFTFKADHQASAATDAVVIGIGGYVKNTGNNLAGVGHLIGIWGHAEDNSAGKHFLIGAEGKVTGHNTADANLYYGMYSYARFIGSTMPATSSIYGLAIQRETTTDGSTALNEGFSTGILVKNAVGSLYNYGISVEDQTGGTYDYGIEIKGADTYALWVGSGADNTDAANGITFGQSGDTQLWRSGASQLMTNATFVANSGISTSGYILGYDSTFTNYVYYHYDGVNSVGDLGVSAGHIKLTGEVEITDTDTGTAAGTSLCIGTDNKICKCGYCN